MTEPHPLLAILLHAANGVFPPADGGVTYLPPIGDGYAVSVAFTAHAILCTTFSEDDLAHLQLDGYGSALDPVVLAHLGGPSATYGALDVMLVARGTGGGELSERFDLDDHSRVRHARAIRKNVRVFGDERGLITLGDGLAGRPEMSIEIPQGTESNGNGRALIAEALRLSPAGSPLFAAVSPGNARSLRAFLAMGFTPIASELHIWSADWIARHS
jgi:hypothetical protein